MKIPEKKVMVMNRKGLFGMAGGTGGGMKMISIVFALILIIVGLIPLLYDFGVISFLLPDIPRIILNVVLVIGGLLLLFDAFRMY